jgi:thioredoxin 1
MITVTRFTANWCIPCKTVGPIMEGIKNDSYFSNVNFITIDIDSNRELASKYGIRSIPTVVIENNGVVVEQLVGTKSRADYEDSIKKWTSK